MSEPPATCLHHLFEQQAARTPDAIALRSERATMTYAELNLRASRLARLLRDRGIGPEKLVGVACERSPHMIAALLGVMKSGGAYVPLDLEAPAARLTDVLRQCGNPLVVATSTARDRVRWVPEDTIVYADRHSPSPPALAGPAPVSAGNLVYVMFTSGSTGQPKGVMTEHAPVVNRLQWMIRNHRLGPGDKVLHKTPVFFDVSVWEMLWPLSTGATLVLARPGGQRDVDYLVRTIMDARITVAHFVPSMLYAFLEHPHAPRCSSLTRVYCSGEALTPALQERFFARLNAVLYNLYGPTETAIEVSQWGCVPGSGTVPIGYPIDNARLYVLDERQQPVPDGEPGELVIAGLPAARGYLGRPGLTADAFLPDPFGPAGTRMYRSGDRARRRQDGAIEYLGRFDDQVKLRGQRIELGEVEACLAGHPGVSRAVVAVKSGGEADQRLVGYVVPGRGDVTTLISELRRRARDRLPGYMVPAAFVTVDHLPLNPAGKVDRDALPDPLATSPGAAQAPRPGMEARIAPLWSGVLRRDADRRERFLDVGGNSLLATVLAARITHELGVAATAAQIITTESLAELASVIATGEPPSGIVAGGPADPGFPVARSLDELRIERIARMPEAEVDELLAELGGPA